MPINKIRQIDALTDLNNSITAFRSESGANFSEIIGGQETLVEISSNQLEIIKGNEEKAYEKSREAFATPAAAAAASTGDTGGAAGVASGATPKPKKGGMLSKAMAGMGALASVGIGLAGLGALFAGGGYLIKQLAEFDGKAVKDNVAELLTIPKLPGATLGNTVDLAATMTAIGGGLMVFSAGAGMASAVTYFEKPWAEDVKANIATLLTIPDMKNAGLGNSIGLAVTLGAIGLGLLAFNAGAATGIAVQGASDAVDHFTKKDDWATQTKKNVETILSINDLPGAGIGTAAKLAVTLGAIGLGLLAFNAGAATGVIVSGADEIVESFAGEDFATKTKNQVATLLSILELPGVKKEGNILNFVKVMAGIGAGLFAFSVGTATATVASGAGDAIAKFTTGEGSFAKKVYDDVDQLLKVTDLTKGAGDEKTGVVGDFVKTMAGIAAGLALFAAGNLVGTLAEAGGAIVRFLTGAESPIKQIEMIAENATKLERGATAIDNIRQALSDFSKLKFKGSKIGMEDFAKDLVAATPLIEGAIMGGTIDPKGSGNKVKVRGLANPDVKFAEAAFNIRMLKEAIGGINNVNDTAAEEKSNNGGGNTVVNNVTNNAGGGGGGGGSEDNLRLATTPMPLTETKSDKSFSVFGNDVGF